MNQADRKASPEELGALLAAIGIIDDAVAAASLSGLYARLKGETQEQARERLAIQRSGHQKIASMAEPSAARMDGGAQMSVESSESPLVREAREKAEVIWKHAEASFHMDEAAYGVQAPSEEYLHVYGEGYRNGFSACYIQDRNTPRARASVAGWGEEAEQGSSHRDVDVVASIKERMEQIRAELDGCKHGTPPKPCVYCFSRTERLGELEVLLDGMKPLPDDSLRSTIQSLIADRTEARRRWADEVMGGGERGERWFHRASPIVYVSELQDVLDGKKFKPSDPPASVLAAVKARIGTEDA